LRVGLRAGTLAGRLLKVCAAPYTAYVCATVLTAASACVTPVIMRYCTSRRVALPLRERLYSSSAAVPSADSGGGALRAARWCGKRCHKPCHAVRVWVRVGVGVGVRVGVRVRARARARARASAPNCIRWRRMHAVHALHAHCSRAALHANPNHALGPALKIAISPNPNP
jgi:hypothetical protein